MQTAVQYITVPRITVNVDDETEAWLEAEADRLNWSKADAGGWCINLMQSSVEHINTQQSAVDYSDVQQTDSLVERVDELEARLRALEDRPEPNPAQVDSKAPTAGGETGGLSPTDTTAETGAADVGDVLDGWNHGRTDEERQASEHVARVALQWLREHNGPARKLDVPLHDLAADDPLDRTENTLWTQVVRPAFQHAAEKGVVEQPHSRAYRWLADPEE